MGDLQGLQEYLDAGYENSIFDRVLEDRKPWEFHLHGQRVIRATIVENSTYDLKVELSIAQPTPHADYYSLRWSSPSTPKETIPQANLGTVHR